MDQKPTLGRIVHYIDDDGREYAAIITGVYYVENSTEANGQIDVCVFDNAANGTVHYKASLLNSSREAGTCHWPERE